MKHRLPLVLSTAALVIAVLGTTPLGYAGDRPSQIVPLAKTSNFAKNAGKLNGHTLVQGAPRRPDPGGRNEREAARDARSRGAGRSCWSRGRSRPGGVAGYQRVQQQQSAPGGNGSERTYSVPCPGGKSVLGGGFALQQGAGCGRHLGDRVDAVLGFGLGIQDEKHDWATTQGACTLSAVCAAVEFARRDASHRGMDGRRAESEHPHR